MEDFKDSVATVFRNALWRGYPKQMVEKSGGRTGGSTVDQGASLVEDSPGEEPTHPKPAFKAARGSLRLVYLASGMRSRQLQLRWKRGAQARGAARPGGGQR